MDNHKSLITSGQFFTLIFVSRLSLTMIYSAQFGKIGSIWNFLISILTLIPVGIVLLIPAVKLYNKTGLSVCQYSVKYFRVFGKIITALYAAYFLYSTLVSLLLANAFINKMLPEGVNAKIIIIILVSGCIYGAAKGIEASARTALLILFMMVPAVILLLTFLLPSYTVIGIPSIQNMIMNSVFDGVFFMISRMNAAATVSVMTPSIKGNIKKSAIIYIVSSCLFLCGMLILYYGSSGSYLDRQNYPVFRVIDTAAALQRLDPLYILIVVCSIFCNLSLFLTSIAKSFSLITQKFSYTKTVICIGIVLCIVVIILPEYSYMFLNVQPIIAAIPTVLFLFLIPILFLLHNNISSKFKISEDKRKLRIASLFLCITICIFSLTGCNALQLNQRIIVQGIGIDKTSTGYHLTVITLDTRKTEEENKVKTVQSNGNSVGDAIIQLEMQSGKKLLLNQCMFIMMNEQSAENADESLSAFTRSIEIPKTVSLMISEASSEETILTSLENYGMFSEDINAVTDSKTIKQASVHCTLLDYISIHSDEFAAVVMPLVTLENDTKSLSAKKGCLVSKNAGCISLSANETTGYLILKGQADMLYPETAESIRTNIMPKNTDKGIEFDFIVSIKSSANNTENIMIKIQKSVEECIKKICVNHNCDVFMLRKNGESFENNLRKENFEPQNMLYNVIVEKI